MVHEAGLNGFGRFGFGLFRAWFFDAKALYTISYLNDNLLKIDDITRILQSDPVITDFHNVPLRVERDHIHMSRPNGREVEIQVTHGQVHSASWLGKPDIMFECSGITRDNSRCHDFLIGNTQNVIVASTVTNADATLVMGYNHDSYDKTAHKVVSFGSCTVIPGVNMLAFMHRHFKFKSCMINIIHSVPKWQLDAGRWKTIARKVCSLERVGPLILPFVKPDTLKINYTYAPYHGVSLMDFQFNLESSISRDSFIQTLTKEMESGRLKNLVTMIDEDTGAENQTDSQYSLVIIKSSIDTRDDRMFFFGYFNNEGSGIRLHELAQHVLAQNAGTQARKTS